ncbi:MAG: IS481 family transposase [Candidatus Omnitrophica bacterium]|nr:IS481 family transposase [Candidatus Omnitrophota bacterium]
MTPQEMLLKHKLSLLQLAEQLQNIRQACKMMGVSRQHYYDIKQRFKQDGVDGLKQTERRPPRMPNQTSEDIESRIIEYSLKHPTYGKDRMPLQLRFEGIIISASAVSRIWKRHGLDNRFKRLLRLEQLHKEQGLVLSDEQIQALLENIRQVPAEHIFSRYPGYLLCQDTFAVGHIKGVGKIYMQAVIDTFGSFGFAKLYTSKLPTTCADILIDRVIPFYMSQDIPIRRMLTDNGGEFCGKEIKHDYELTLQIFGIEHKRIRVGTPQSNGFVERFNRTVLEEFFCVAFRKKWYHTLEELQKDLDTYLWHYNFQRPHLGYRLKGKRPIEVLLDRSTYPKRLTCDKMSPSESQEVSTHLETCTAGSERRSESRPSG